MEKAITQDMLLPEIVERYPATRAVLDRYGLKGCGGPLGPRESIAWFARMHGVPLEQLLAELNDAAARQPQPAEHRPSPADTIYRPFFLAGIAAVLSVGCLWGAVNLLFISLARSFGGIDYSWVLAHGNAMVFGFVGFFIMGFAYQAVPRFKHTTLWRPGLALSALPLMAGGIVLQTTAHLLAPRPPFLPLGLAAGLLQFSAVFIFALTITGTIRRARKPEPYDRFIYASLGWFLLAALGNPFIFWLFETARDRAEFLFRVSVFNIPYRDIQLLGIAVVMIIGVSLRYLPHAYSLREPPARWRAFLLWGVNGAILLGIAAFLAAMLSGNYRLLAAYEAAALLLLVAAVGTPRQYRLFGAVPESERDRGLKFIRAAYIWFAAAIGMLVLAPAYNLFIYRPYAESSIPFSHAFFGAYRHALTVGFIAMMIVGVSSKVVPTLAGIEVRRAGSLWPTFILLNVGNMLRVGAQITTDFTAAAFALIGISGFIEVLGLALWGYELVANMRYGVRRERAPLARASANADGRALDPQTKVADLLEQYPQALEVFLRHGFTPLRNPLLRRTLARAVTLEQACRREGIPLEALLADLRDIVGGGKEEE